MTDTPSYVLSSESRDCTSHATSCFPFDMSQDHNHIATSTCICMIGHIAELVSYSRTLVSFVVLTTRHPLLRPESCIFFTSLFSSYTRLYRSYVLYHHQGDLTAFEANSDQALKPQRLPRAVA